jgi:ketosteroid isomerase-like protein
MTMHTIELGPGAPVVTALTVAQKFVERINAADVAGLAALMTEDHRFVDSLGNEVSGREAAPDLGGGWRGRSAFAEAPVTDKWPLRRT